MLLEQDQDTIWRKELLLKASSVLMLCCAKEVLKVDSTGPGCTYENGY